MTRALGCQTHAFCEEECQSLARKVCCECGFHHSGLPQKVEIHRSQQAFPEKIYLINTGLSLDLKLERSLCQAQTYKHAQTHVNMHVYV